MARAGVPGPPALVVWRVYELNRAGGAAASPVKGRGHELRTTRDTHFVDEEMSVFAGARQAIMSCQGFGLESLSLSIIGTADALEIGLRWGVPKPDVTLSIRNIHYLAIHRMPGDDIPFVDIEATTLAPDQPWPKDLPNPIVTVDGFPPLLWIRGHGPATFDVVAATVTVLSEVE